MRQIRILEKPVEPLLDDEQKNGIIFLILRIGIVLAALGAVGLLVAFLTRTSLTALGFTWRRVQMFSLAFGFGGLALFKLSTKALNIDTSDISLNKVLAILRNEKYVPPLPGEPIRLALASTLRDMDDQWCLFCDVRLDGFEIPLEFVLTGPKGMFALEVNKTDPRRPNYKDPAIKLLAASEKLSEQFDMPVVGVIPFFRHKASYESKYENVKAFTMTELVTWLEARPTKLTKTDLVKLEDELKELVYQYSEPEYSAQISSIQQA